MSDYQNGAVGMHSAVSLATNLHDLKVEDTTIQAILQHSNVAVTWKCYIQDPPRQSVAAIEQLEAAMCADRAQKADKLSYKLN